MDERLSWSKLPRRKGTRATSCWQAAGQAVSVWESRATRMSLCFHSGPLLPPWAPGRLPRWRGRLWASAKRHLSEAAPYVSQTARLLCHGLWSTLGSFHHLKCLLQPHGLHPILPWPPCSQQERAFPGLCVLRTQLRRPLGFLLPPAPLERGMP